MWQQLTKNIWLAGAPHSLTIKLIKSFCRLLELKLFPVHKLGIYWVESVHTGLLSFLRASVSTVGYLRFNLYVSLNNSLRTYTRPFLCITLTQRPSPGHHFWFGADEDLSLLPLRCLFFSYGFLEMNTSADFSNQSILVFHQPLLLPNHVLDLFSLGFLGYITFLMKTSLCILSFLWFFELSTFFPLCLFPPNTPMLYVAVKSALTLDLC